MKKLLYSGLMALMMFFAFGSASAENAKVKVVLDRTTWALGSTTTTPEFTVTITQATTESGAETREGELALGEAEGNVAVKVTLTKDGTTKEQVITSSKVALTTTGLTAGTWTLSYDFVKGEDHDATFENVDNDASSTASLTIVNRVPVSLSATTWDGTTESALPKFTVTATEGITFGNAEGNAAVKVNFYKVESTPDVEFDQFIEAAGETAIANPDNKLTEGVWMLSYSLVKGDDHNTLFVDDGVNVAEANMQLTVGSASTKTSVKVEFMPNKAAEGSEDEAAYSVSILGETGLGLGTTENDLAVLVTFTKGETTKTTLLTSTYGDLNLKTIGLTLGEWAVSYKFIKGNGTATTNEELADVEASAQSTATFTVIPVAPTFTPAAGAILARTPVTVKSTTTAYKVYYRLGTKQGEYTTNNTNSVKFPINDATTVYACAVTEDGASSDTVEAAYTIKDCTFTGTLSLLSPADKNGSYTTPDTVYNDAAPEFEAKVEGLTLSNETLGSKLRYSLYQNFDGKDSLMSFGLASKNKFKLSSGSLDNGIYKVVVDIVENGPYDMDNERIRVAYTKTDGTAVEVVRYIRIAAPVWTLESPELEVVEDEEGEETIVPIKLLPGEGLEVVVKAENCEGLYGTGEGQLLISKRVCANSLLAVPAVAQQMNPCYEIMDTVLGEDGRIRFSLPEGWVDSIRKVVTTNVDKLLAMYEEEDGPMSDAEKAAFYAMYGLAEGEDLSDCSVDLQVYEWMDMSDYDMDPMLMPSEKYFDMFVNVPFSVADTTLAPTFSVDGGAVLKGSELVIVANIATDTIYYRLNEGAFQKAEKVNIAKIAINEASKVEAYAIGRNNRKSPTADASFTVVSLPTLEVKKVGKFTINVDTVVFDGAAAFDAFVTVPEGLEKTDYQIEVNYADAAEYIAWYNFDEGADKYTTLNIGSFDVADSVRIDFKDVYNGKYVVWFSLKDITAMAGGVVDNSEVEFYINVTNYAEPEPEPEPELTVVAAGKNTMNGETVVFDGTAAFKMNLVPAQGDTTTYRIIAELYTKLAFDTMGEYITVYSYNAADTLAEFVGVYNGEYGVHFYAEKVYTLSGKPEEVGEPADFRFNVTNYEAPVYTDPTFAVAVAGKNEMKENTVVFDGPAAFKMKVGEMSEGDSLKIAAVIYTKINFDTFGEPITTNSYEATDEDAEFLGIYNGEYAVRFQLQRYSLMLRDFASITDTVFYFNVTNYEEIIENYELTIKPVGAEVSGDSAAYKGNVVFDIFVKGLTEKDSMTLATTIYTPAQYGDTVEVAPRSVVAAKDSVRFDARLSDGEYVAVVELKRAGQRDEDIVVEFATLYIRVSGVAIEVSELAGVNVYPNPNAGAFNVAVPERARIDIFGLNGAKVMSREVNAGVEAFQLNHSGIYFVRVMAGNKTAVKRVVVR